MDFMDFFDELESFGMMDALLPFILIFTVIYAVLSNVNIFGKENRSVNFVVAGVMALIPVILHVTGRFPHDKDAIVIINESLPIAIALAIGSICVLFLIGTFQGEAQLRKFEIGTWVVGLAVLFYINFAFPDVPFWVAMLSAFIIIVVGSKKGTSHSAASGLVFLIIVAIIYIFGSRAGYFEELPYWMENETLMMFVIVILVFFAVAAFISSGGKED